MIRGAIEVSVWVLRGRVVGPSCSAWRAFFIGGYCSVLVDVESRGSWGQAAIAAVEQSISLPVSLCSGVVGVAFSSDSICPLPLKP